MECESMMAGWLAGWLACKTNQADGRTEKYVCGWKSDDVDYFGYTLFSPKGGGDGTADEGERV